MAERYEVYKCGVCGNLIEVMAGGAGELVCCGKPMRFMKEGTSDGALEKHVPVIEKNGDVYRVKVGSVAHPMQDDHWIQWIELVADGVSYTKFLDPGDAPEAEFVLPGAKNVFAREYCNLHGHWKSV